jgi:hypothetical protein
MAMEKLKRILDSLASLDHALQSPPQSISGQPSKHDRQNCKPADTLPVPRLLERPVIAVGILVGAEIGFAGGQLCAITDGAGACVILYLMALAGEAADLSGSLLRQDNQNSRDPDDR